jgi:hypothetical protein
MAIASALPVTLLQKALVIHRRKRARIFREQQLSKEDALQKHVAK